MEWLIGLGGVLGIGALLGPLAPLLGGGALVGVLAWFGLRGSLSTFFQSTKLWLIVGGVVLILGGIAYHSSVVAGLREDIEQKVRDNEKLTASNASLEAANAAARTNLQTVLQELANVRAADTEARNQLAATQAALRNTENRARLTRLRSEAAGAETIVREANLNSRCRAANFGRTGGSCISGVWTPTP